jgi:hypothetical protein
MPLSARDRSYPEPSRPPDGFHHVLLGTCVHDLAWPAPIQPAEITLTCPEQAVFKRHGSVIANAAGDQLVRNCARACFAASCTLLLSGQIPSEASGCHAQGLLEMAGEVTLIGEAALDGNLRGRQAAPEQALRLGNPQPDLVGVWR